MAQDQFWIDGVIPWSYVSTSNNIYVNGAVHVDDNVGLDMYDVETIENAMKQIEDQTCIKFPLVKPVKGQPWLFIHRDAKAKLNSSDPQNCQIAYAKVKLVGKDINGLGDIYGYFAGADDDDCFYGASADYGSDSPQTIVISEHYSDPNYEGSVGLMIHELLHVIGIGHTQKRRDAYANIKINWANIKKDSQYEYEP